MLANPSAAPLHAIRQFTGLRGDEVYFLAESWLPHDTPY
jgi:hypothetical protein